MMCEILTVKSDDAIEIEWIMKYATLLEEYGFAGFGWGIAWKSDSGEIQRYRAVDGIRKDTLAPQTLKGIKAKEYLVHLRKPSLMKSISFNNAQPYLNEDKTLAFAHNGYFSNHLEFRNRWANALEGTSDSEIGYHFFLHKQNEGMDSKASLSLTHQSLEGKANLVVFRKNEETLLYAGNEDNSMYVFNLEGVQCASTSLHSHDDYVFQAIFPTATDIQSIPLYSCYELSGSKGEAISNC